MYQATYIIVIFSLFRRIGETFFSLVKFRFFEAIFFWYDTCIVLVPVPDNSSVIECHLTYLQQSIRTGTGTSTVLIYQHRTQIMKNQISFPGNFFHFMFSLRVTTVPVRYYTKCVHLLQIY